MTRQRLLHITRLTFGIIVAVFSSTHAAQCSVPVAQSASQANGTILSPSYPSYPRQNERCRWWFDISENQVLVLEVVDLKLYRDFRCGRGYGRLCKDCLQTLQIAEADVTCQVDVVKCRMYAHKGHCSALQLSYSRCETTFLTDGQNRIALDFSSAKITIARGNPPKGFKLEYKIIDCPNRHSSDDIITATRDYTVIEATAARTAVTTGGKASEVFGEPDDSESTTIAILYVVIGILVVTIITLAIMLCCCYRTLQLQKAHKELPNKWKTQTEKI